MEENAYAYISTKTISILVYQEGKPDCKYEASVSYKSVSSAQSMWTSFMDQIAFKIGVHIGKRGLEGIYEDSTGSPVYRIVSLINGGVYMVRPTEEWALMRTLEKYSVPTTEATSSSLGYIPSATKSSVNRNTHTSSTSKPEPFPAYEYIEYAREQNKTLQELYDEWFDKDEKMGGQVNNQTKLKKEGEEDKFDLAKPPSGKFGPLPTLSIPSGYVFYEPMTEEEKVDRQLQLNATEDVDNTAVSMMNDFNKATIKEESNDKDRDNDDKNAENSQLMNPGKRAIDESGNLSFPPLKYFDAWYHDLFALPKTKIRMHKEAKEEGETEEDDENGKEAEKEEDGESLELDDESSMLSTTKNLEIPEYTKKIQDCKNLSTLLDLLNSVEDLRAGKEEGTSNKRNTKNDNESNDIRHTDYFDDDDSVDWNDNLSLPSSPTSSEDEDEFDEDNLENGKKERSNSAFSQTSINTYTSSMDNQYEDDDNNSKSKNIVKLLGDDELSDEGPVLSEKNIILVLLKIGTLLQSSFKYRQEFYVKLYIVEFKAFLDFNRRKEHLVKPALAALVAYCTKPIYQKQIHEYKIMRFLLDVFPKTIPTLPDSISIATTTDVDIRPKSEPVLLLPCLITVYSALHENDELIQIYLSEVKPLLFLALEYACYPTFKSPKLGLWCLIAMLDYHTYHGCFSHKWAKLVTCLKSKFYFDNDINLFATQIFELCNFYSDSDHGEKDQYIRDLEKIEERISADPEVDNRRKSVRILLTKGEVPARSQNFYESIREGDNEGGMYS